MLGLSLLRSARANVALGLGHAAWYVIAMKKMAVVLFALAVATSGCGESATGDGGAAGSGGSGGSGGSPPQTIITMSGTVEITGDNTASGAFSAPGYTRQPSCAAYAAEGSAASDPGQMETEGTFRIPGPPIGVPLTPSGDVYASTLRIMAAFYQGPGTYVNDVTTDHMDGQIVLNELPGGPPYFLEDGAATVTINADSSGTLTFQDIPEDTDGIETFISGTVTWVCTEDD
jgi:hypothetical protein